MIDDIAVWALTLCAIAFAWTARLFGHPEYWDTLAWLSEVLTPIID